MKQRSSAGRSVQAHRGIAWTAGLLVLAVVLAWYVSTRYRNLATDDSASAAGGPRAGETVPLASADEARRPLSADSPGGAGQSIAEIHIRDEVIRLTPNAHGDYPRMSATPGGTVQISLPLTRAEPGELIAVQAEDGGLLLGEASAGNTVVDEDRRVRFAFQLGTGDGAHRVTVGRGSEAHVLEFWTGPEQPVLVRQ